MTADGTQPCRVAMVLASTSGGTGRHAAALVAGLVADGYQVTVNAPRAVEARFGFSALGAGFRPVEISAAPRAGDLRAVRALRASIRETGAEVVHAHSLRAGLVASLARPRGTPLVVTWHNTVLAGGLRRALYAPLERRVARAADVTLGVSGDLVARVTALGGRDVRRALVPAPPLTPPARTAAQVRAELGLEPGQPLILSVGRLHPQKGLDVLVAAAARWRDRSPRPLVVIAGSGPAQAELERRIAEEDAPVRLLGDRGDVPDLLAAADVVAVTSIWEGQPLFVQEALAAGVPVVATAVGGVPELVGDGARLVAPNDAGAVDAAVAALLDDPAERAALGARGRARAATWPTGRDALDQVEGIYRELRARLGAPRGN